MEKLLAVVCDLRCIFGKWNWILCLFLLLILLVRGILLPKKERKKKREKEKIGFLPSSKEIKQKQSITTEPVSKWSMIHNSSAANNTSLYLLLGANTNSAGDCCSQKLGQQFPRRSLSTF